MPAYQKKEQKKIEVRGYWGDIVQAPYAPFSLLYKEPEKKDFFKTINMQAVYSTMDANLFNVQNIITVLEDLKEYDFPF